MTIVKDTTRVLVSATPKAAFKYVSDLTTHPEWSGGKLTMKAITSGPVAVGSQYQSVGGENDKINLLHVTRYDPSTNFTFVAHDPQFGDITHEFTFTAQDGGTLISRTVTTEASPLQAFIFRNFLYPRRGKPLMEKAMASLRAHFEKIR